MTDGPDIARQWVSIPGGSVDVRIGAGATDQISTFMRGVSGKDPRCLLVYGPDLPEDVLVLVRRGLIGGGYKVTDWVSESQEPCMESATGLLAAMGHAHITKDDVVFAAGSVGLLSVASFACDVWCGGMPLALYPMDLDAFVESAATPRALDCAGLPQMVKGRPSCRRMFCDTDVVSRDEDAETSRLARGIMVATAMAAGEKEFSRLWDNAEDLMAGDVQALVTVLGDCVKGRGRLVSSTSIALRQSVSYGNAFVRAMRTLVPADIPNSMLLAEGLRFFARVSAGMGRLAVDDVFAQDDLLEALGLGQTPACDVEPGLMRQALREECFRHTNRFMLELPQAIGRVRLTAVDDDLLCEHTDAWCSAHATEAATE